MPSHPRTAREALARLREGNQRFVGGRPLHGKKSAEGFGRSRDGRRPLAMIPGRGDSRVPPGLAFDRLIVGAVYELATGRVRWLDA